jgi:hypothetical protein
VAGRFEFVVLVGWNEIDHFWADTVVLKDEDRFYQALYGTTASVLSRRSFQLGKEEHETLERKRRERQEGKRERYRDSDDDDEESRA